MQFNRAQVRDAVQALAEYFNAGGNSWGEIDDEYVQGEMEALEGEFDNLGVISFTEDFDNPLMWAHYADEHRGWSLSSIRVSRSLLDHVFRLKLERA